MRSMMPVARAGKNASAARAPRPGRDMDVTGQDEIGVDIVGFQGKQHGMRRFEV